MFYVMRTMGKGIKPLCLAEYPTIEQARTDLMSRKGSVYIQYPPEAIARENAALNRSANVVPMAKRKPRVCPVCEDSACEVKSLACGRSYYYGESFSVLEDSACVN